MSESSSSDNLHERKTRRDEFVHHIAVRLSRSLNTLNPNDGLANTVIGFAKNAGEDFAKFKTGLFKPTWPNLAAADLLPPHIQPL